MNESQNTYKDKKYKDDTTFQRINKKFLTLDENETKKHNAHLNQVVRLLFIPLMEQDELFKDTFQKIMYGGSFYKKTKFGNPQEFDLDFVFKLPIDTSHDHYGFVKICVDESRHQHPNWNKHERILTSWLDKNKYLMQDKFRSWFERVFVKAYDQLAKKLDKNNYRIKHKKSGPAFTLLIETPEGWNIDVDVVPCFEFDKILKNGYRLLDSLNKRKWYAIPKPFSFTDANILWRLCFYEHEKDLLEGNFKDVIRMIKKFRDTRRWHSIASYYIETIFYHEISRHKEQQTLNEFICTSKTGLFMHGLKQLLKAFEMQYLAYFWHPKHNLLSKINSNELCCYKNNLRKIISKIDAEITVNKLIIAEYVLSVEDGKYVFQGVPRQEIFSEPEASSVSSSSQGYNCNLL